MVPLHPLEPGIGFLAYKSLAPIIPIYISGACDVWGKTRKFPKLFGKVTCHIGPPILPATYSPMDKKAFMKKVVQDAEASLTNLQNKARL